MNHYKLIIFDMDGTLVDTSAGILQCHKYALVQMGRPEPTDKELEGIIGGPLLNTYLSRFGFSQDNAVEAVKIYRKHYAEYGIKNVQLYPGMKEALQELKRAGFKLAVATLKAEVFAKRILEQLEIEQLFDVIHGVDKNDALSKADLIELCMSDLNVEKNESVIIGDSVHDERGALEAGIDFVAVSYGFGYTEKEAEQCRAVFSVSSPVELEEKITRSLNK